jgi:hypothetical protein
VSELAGLAGLANRALVYGAGMDSHPDKKFADGGRPLLGEEEELGINGGLHSLDSGGEGSLRSIANRSVGITAVGLDGSLQDLFVARVSSLHRSWVSLP